MFKCLGKQANRCSFGESYETHKCPVGKTQRFHRCIHTSVKSLHFASLHTLVTTGYMFFTSVVTALQWNVIDGKLSVRIRRRVEKCVVLKKRREYTFKTLEFFGVFASICYV